MVFADGLAPGHLQQSWAVGGYCPSAVEVVMAKQCIRKSVWILGEEHPRGIITSIIKCGMKILTNS